MRHVVAVADERQLQAVQTAEALLQRQHVRQRLAGMIQIAQRVDHRHARPVRQLFDGGLRKHARHDALRPAVQIPRDVFHRLALADGPDVIHRIAAQLLDRQLEGQPRAQRRLFKQKAEGTATERIRKIARGSFHPVGEIQKVGDLLLRQVEVAGKISRRRFQDRFNLRGVHGQSPLYSGLNFYSVVMNI